MNEAWGDQVVARAEAAGIGRQEAQQIADWVEGMGVHDNVAAALNWTDVVIKVRNAYAIPTMRFRGMVEETAKAYTRQPGQ